MFFNDFFDLVVVCKDIEPRYGGTRTRGFFSTVRLVSFTTCMFFIIFLRHISYSLIFKLKDSKDSKDSNSVCRNKYIRNQRKEVNRSRFLP